MLEIEEHIRFIKLGTFFALKSQGGATPLPESVRGWRMSPATPCIRPCMSTVQLHQTEKKPCAGLDHTTNGWSHIGDSRTGFFLMFSVSPCMIIIHLISINPRFLAPPPRLMFMFYSRQTNRYLISISLTLMFSFN